MIPGNRSPWVARRYSFVYRNPSCRLSIFLARCLSSYEVQIQNPDTQLRRGCAASIHRRRKRLLLGGLLML